MSSFSPLRRPSPDYYPEPLIPGAIAVLQTLHQQEPDTAITLRADRSAEYGNVAQVLSEVRNAGITQLSVITETP